MHDLVLHQKLPVIAEYIENFDDWRLHKVKDYKGKSLY